MKKGVLKNFTKFTGKHLCQGLFFDKVAGLLILLKDAVVQMCSVKGCSKKFHKIHRKTPAPGSLFK